MLTLEQKAWQLWENGVTFSELDMTAINHGCSADFAVELLWNVKIGDKSMDHCCQGIFDEDGWEIGCCFGK